ncbi:MAG: hypothetical protein FJ119_13540 [Deltaproteobacteria bacterium]|nr:hypothetical protein [Deltaproteobacteria bacterium]
MGYRGEAPVREKNMQYQFFTIPVFNFIDAQEELNRFLRGRRIISVQKEFVSRAESSFWALAVEYIEHGEPAAQTQGRLKAKVDYREVLPEKDFALYSRLREARKRIADAEAVPVYAVFTNEHLAEMVRRKVATKADMAKIDGVGEMKVEKYADKFLLLLREQDEKVGPTA